MALADTAALAIQINLTGNARSGIRGLKGDLAGLSGSLGRVGRGFGQIGTGLAKSGLLIGGAVVTGLSAAAKAGADFEAQLNTINTIARATPDELTAIGDGIRELARDGRGDLSDLTAAFYDVLSAGITDAAEAQKVLASASTLAIGGLSTNAQAVDLLTTAINAYGQEASEAQKDADLFAKAIEIGKVTADEIAASFANVAPIAAQQSIEIEEIAAAYAALTAQGTPAAEVTTQMQRAIVELLDPGKELLSLQDKLGVSFLKIAQDEGLVVALQKMRDAVGDDDEAFKALFGRVEGYKFALQTTGPQQKIYNDALAAMGDSAGTASEQMGERQKGLAYAVGRLKANLVDAGLTLSSGFLPALTRTADKLSGLLGDAETRGELQALGKSIGDAIDNIDWQKVLEGAKALGSAMKSALDFTLLILQALDKLPTEIKGAAVGFLALNKLSGGLLASGVGNVVGGLGGAAATGLASRAPGVGRLFAQPVFVTNWPLGGIGGGAGAGGGGIGLGAIFGAGAILTIGYGLGEAFAGYLRSQGMPVGAGGGATYRPQPAFTNTTTSALGPRTGGLSPDERQEHNDTQRALDTIRERNEANRIALVSALDRSKTAVVSGAHSDRNAIVTAIRQSRPILNVSVKAYQNVTRVSYTTATTMQAAQGSGPGGAVPDPW